MEPDWLIAERGHQKGRVPTTYLDVLEWGTIFRVFSHLFVTEMKSIVFDSMKQMLSCNSYYEYYGIELSKQIKKRKPSQVLRYW